MKKTTAKALRRLGDATEIGQKGMKRGWMKLSHRQKGAAKPRIERKAAELAAAHAYDANLSPPSVKVTRG